MPQVSGNFGPLYQSVTLDGTGSGTVFFQAQGSAIRISNIFFKVATSTEQAQCFIYKGQVAEGNIIFNSNSGSTGGNAKGNVDLFDGETVFVRWTGGDPGATATATFTGAKINFHEIEPSLLSFDDPIAAGDGSLIFPALKSPNYVAGVTGWMIGRDGDAEFNNATIRGTLVVTGSDNSYIQINTVGGDPYILLRPDDIPGYVNYNAAISPATLQAFSVDQGAESNSFTRLRIGGAPLTGAPGSNTVAIDLASQQYDGTTRPSFALRSYPTAGQPVDFFCDASISILGSTSYVDYGIDAGKGRIGGGGTNVNSAAITTLETDVVVSDVLTFKAGRAYQVIMSGSANLSAAPNRAVQRLRKNSPAGQFLGLSGIQAATTGTAPAGWTQTFYVGASDVTCALSWTSIVNSGVVSVTYQGATTPTMMDIFDIGIATETNIDNYAIALT